MKNEKEIIICVGLGVMVVDTAEDAAAVGKIKEAVKTQDEAKITAAIAEVKGS